MSSVKTKEDVRDLFDLYFEFRKNQKGSHEVDVSALDHEAFVEALNKFFYDTSISIDQYCLHCKKRVRAKYLRKNRWSCEKCKNMPADIPW